MSNLLLTRGQIALSSNNTPKRLRARTEKAVSEIKKRIEKLSIPYEDVDNSVVGAKDELYEAFDKFSEHILQTQQYLEETL